jgi:uncharacterized protein
MILEENKRLVANYLDRFQERDIQGLLATMTDDATWWVNGRPELYRDAGTRTKAEMAVAWRELYDQLNGALKMEPVSMVAEGDRVAAEVRSHAITKAGKAYDNDFHMLFSIRDGKIASVREYTDVMLAKSVFG